MAPIGALRVGDQSAERMPTKDIVFDNVAFTYEAGTLPVLDGFNLTIPAGTSLAIVGQNGAGKTTLAKLLCRLYDPDDNGGSIRVDGQNLSDIDIESWRSRVTAVFQDFIRYERSLRHNVAPTGSRRGRHRRISRRRRRRRPRRSRHDPGQGLPERNRTLRWAVAARCVGTGAVRRTPRRGARSARRADRPARREGRIGRYSSGCSLPRTHARQSSSRTASRLCASPIRSASSRRVEWSNSETMTS